MRKNRLRASALRLGSQKEDAPRGLASAGARGVNVVSTEDKNSSAPSPAKERDEEIDKIRESMRAEYEARRRKDEESARARGARVVQLVEAELSHVAQMMEKPLTMRRRVWSTEEQLAARRAEMANAAEATKRQHARKRHANPEALEGATREQCAAEYGPIMGFPYRPEDEAAFKPLAEIVAPGEVKARAIYTQLRKAITEARDLAFRLPGGSGGAAGRALFYMRGILPVLPGLNEPPFNKHVRPGRAAFVHEREELFRHVQRERRRAGTWPSCASSTASALAGATRRSSAERRDRRG